MKSYEKRIFEKYPALMVGRFVYFNSTPRVRRAIAAGRIRELTPRKLYKIQEASALVYIKADNGHTIGVILETMTSAHLAELARFRLYSRVKKQPRQKRSSS